MSGINLSLMMPTFTRSFLLRFPEHILADIVKEREKERESMCALRVHWECTCACARICDCVRESTVFPGWV